MIQRIAPVFADSLTVLWPCIEHQYRADGGVVSENSKHSSLVIVIEVKEAVPSENAIESPTER